MPEATLHGALVVDKPEGPTSHDVVNRARRALGTRQIGHTGTLDPMATGVLTLVLGHATRLTQFLVGHDKAYDAIIRLGRSTDTWDRTGTVVAECSPDTGWPSEERIRSVVDLQLGAHDQVPPPYSAKKVGGVRAYALARQGREVAVQPARVVLHSADVLSIALPLVQLRIRCSSGYYVRALADTVGRELGCGGCLESLRRTASGHFSLESAVSLRDIDESPAAVLERIVPLEAMLPGAPQVRLNDEGLRRALNGNDVDPRHFEGPCSGEAEPILLLGPDGRLVAVASPVGQPGLLHPAVVLK